MLASTEYTLIQDPVYMVPYPHGHGIKFGQFAVIFILTTFL